VLKRLKNWWLDRRQLLEITAYISISSFAFGITVLDCRAQVELDLTKAFHWLHVFRIFRQHKIWWTKVGKNKSFEVELYCTGSLSTGVTFCKYIHCDHTPCHLDLELLGIILGADYHDVRHWDDANGTYEICAR